MKKLPKARTSDLIVQKSNEETLVYDVKNNTALCLNETSSTIWNALDGKSSTAQIAERVNKKLDDRVGEEVVSLAIDQLKKEGLIENADEVETAYDDLSRREVIRKIGFTSVVALPLVSSIVAPEAISAQSCISPGTGVPGNAIVINLPADPTGTCPQRCADAVLPCSPAANTCSSGAANLINVFLLPPPPAVPTQCRCNAECA